MVHHRYSKIEKEDWVKTFVYIAAFVAVLIVGSVLLLPSYWYLWLILVVGGLFLLVQWHAKNFAYRCPECGHEFEISTFTDFISPQGVSKSGSWKYLKCPNCHKRSRAMVIKKTDKQWLSL